MDGDPLVTGEVPVIDLTAPFEADSLDTPTPGVTAPETENRVTEETALTSNGDKTKRTLGVVVVMSLTVIAIAVLGLLAFVAFRSDASNLKLISDTVQPGTVIVAIVAAIAGIAAGAGLKDN